jgi:thymidylate synthase (FAD)
MAWTKIWLPESYDSERDAVCLGSRTTSERYDELVKLFEPIYQPMLDHGFVGLIDFMGDDDAIAEAARVSYQRGTKKISGTEGLIRYLMRHKHTTPFEMAEVKYHVKAPIFVFRQWHRHRTASINEMSARYSVLDNEMYIPEPEDMAAQSSANKQGRSEVLTAADYLAVAAAMEQVNHDAYGTYQYLLGKETTIVDGKEEVLRFPPPDAINSRKLFVESQAVEAIQKIKRDKRARGEVWQPTEQELNDKIAEYYAANGLQITSVEYPGIARELARMVLPVSTYSQMYWKTNLWNLFRFLQLRMDPHAQKEIRVYTDQMYEMVKPIYPASCRAFEDYVLDAKTFSRMDLSVIVALVRESWRPGYTPDWIRQEIGPGLGMSKREIDELIQHLEPK